MGPIKLRSKTAVGSKGGRASVGLSLLGLLFSLGLGAPLCLTGGSQSESEKPDRPAAASGATASSSAGSSERAFSRPSAGPFSYLGVIYASRQRGARVVDVLPNSPAQRCGLQVEDTIVAVNGMPVVGSYGLRLQIERIRPGKSVEISVRRYNLLQLKLRATLERRPENYFANYLTMGI